MSKNTTPKNILKYLVQELKSKFAEKSEIPSVNDNTITIQLNGTTVETFTLNQNTDETINIQVTKSSVGLDNVPNVATNDQTPTFTQASTRANIASGEKLSVIFGKIMKWFADLKAVAFSGSYSDLSNKPSSLPASDVYAWAKEATKPTYTKAEIGLGNVDNTADANKNVKYATSAGSAAKGTNNKFETTFLTLGSNGNEPSVTMYNSVSGDGTLKVGMNPNDTAMGSSGRNLYLPIGSMYSSGQATLATVEYINSKIVYIYVSNVPRGGGHTSVSYPTGFNFGNTVIIGTFLYSGGIRYWGSGQAGVVNNDTNITLYNNGGAVGDVCAFLYKNE